jgi:hypothetical protein
MTAEQHGVFISYRREDVPGHAGRLYDRLTQRFGEARVFMDVDSIELGRDFVSALEEAVASCEVMLVLIGPRWVSTAERRLDDPHDYVRVEVQTALDRDIRVVPVLVHGASLPSPEVLPEQIRPLVRRQAVELGDASFQSDSRLLIERLEPVLGDGVAPAAPRSETPWQATCQQRGRPVRSLQVTLAHSSHVIEYENRAVRANEVRLDGQVVGKTGVFGSGVDTTKERYEFPVPDGPETRTAVVEVRLGSVTIKEVALTVDGRTLYRGP